MSKQIRYTETQSMYWFVGLFVFITIFILLATYFQWGSKPITSWLFALPLIVINILPILAFYNMKIIIDLEVASVKFGIGWLQRKIPIQDLDLSTAEIVRLPWYAGVGYRINSKGTFFNTRPGAALLIKTKNRNTEFFVGTKNGEQIITILKEIQKDKM
ncbi:hypothetical protein [uncultured Dokdonia sp.]|uniref:hypothetical protein n=1 Tax=uncultured Dokdonia sp. TaxID=575653 RepID=UPI00260A0C58|nr:hypothetical protein [uncultured Dokdonia sp.]